MFTVFTQNHEQGEHGLLKEAVAAAPQAGWRARYGANRPYEIVREIASLLLGQRRAARLIQFHTDGGLEPPPIDKRLEAG
jgi:hypothetical protein